MEKICSIKNVIDISYKKHLDCKIYIYLKHKEKKKEKKRKLSVTEIQTTRTVTAN